MDYRIEGDKLIIEIDVGPGALIRAQPSKSGKTRVVASTNGFVRVSDKQSFALNLVTK